MQVIDLVAGDESIPVWKPASLLDTWHGQEAGLTTIPTCGDLNTASHIDQQAAATTSPDFDTGIEASGEDGNISEQDEEEGSAIPVKRMPIRSRNILVIPDDED